MFLLIPGRDQSPSFNASETPFPAINQADSSDELDSPPPPPALPPEFAEQEVPEMRYLPAGASAPAGSAHPILGAGPRRSGDRRIAGARPITSMEKHGAFLNPLWSPDGLQLLASRPGYSGVWLLGLNGEDPVQIAEGNGYSARWTPDGKIEVTGEDGKVQRYTPEGVLETADAEPAAPPPAYGEDDTIWVRPSDGSSAFPLTGGDDRYFNPVVSPDGRYVAYQGLNTGLYVARTDGSGEPVYLGPGGNPAWLPDSSGILFDVTRDDGHNLIEGDLYHADIQGETRTNLTEGDDLITQHVSVGPDGRVVTYEADGEIYIGVLE